MNVLKTVNLLVGIVLIILLVVAGVYLNKLVNKDPVKQNTTVFLKSNPACDLNKQGCVASIDHQSVELRFKPAVKYLTRFDIEVVTSGFNPEMLEAMNVNFTMTGMQMGFNRFSLKKTQKKNVWQGMAILPVCVSGRKDWRVELSFGNSELNYTAIYNLIVEN